MNEFTNKIKDNFWSDIKTIFSKTKTPDDPIKKIFFYFGLIFCLIPAGALLGFRYAYNKLGLQYEEKKPWLSGQPNAVYSMMVLGALLGIIVPIVLTYLIYSLTHGTARDFSFGGFVLRILLIWAIVNLGITSIFFRFWNNWRSKIFNYLSEITRYGTARFAKLVELLPFVQEAINTARGAFYIGGRYYYSKQGHLLTVAGTRAGKGVNLLTQNLLPAIGRFIGSWVVVDPKGELAAICARILREAGKKVILLNPWNLLGLGNAAYNPLDLLKHDRLNLSDDIDMIAESIVPMSAGGDKDHFDNRARSLIASLLMHLVTAYRPEDRQLSTIWEWLRYDIEQWKELVKEMHDNETELGSEIVQAAASEIASMMESGAREFSSIMSTARKHTDFMKSPAIRDSMQAISDFTSADLADANTVVFIIIPVDRLKTQPRWLRLVVSTLIRSVVRNPKGDVAFLLDEAYALGYLSEIEVALGSYAGFGIHLWTVWQNLVQLRDLYGNNWENFISCCSVRHFFNVNDNFTADYISKSFGTYSVPTYDNQGNVNGATARNLVNPDELNKQSGDVIYTVIENLHPAKFAKLPYFQMGLVEGKDYDKNPYYKGD